MRQAQIEVRLVQMKQKKSKCLNKCQMKNEARSESSKLCFLFQFLSSTSIIRATLLSTLAYVYRSSISTSHLYVLLRAQPSILLSTNQPDCIIIPFVPELYETKTPKNQSTSFSPLLPGSTKPTYLDCTFHYNGRRVISCKNTMYNTLTQLFVCSFPEAEQGNGDERKRELHLTNKHNVISQQQATLTSQRGNMTGWRRSPFVSAAWHP